MYKDVYVFCEQRDGIIQNVSYELIGKAKELARDLGQEVVGVIAGHNIGALPQKLIERGADKVIIADKPILEQYSTKPYTDVMVKVINDQFGIKEGLMSTIHASTSKQKPVDSNGGRDWRTAT